MSTLASVFRSNENENLRVAFYDGKYWTGNVRIDSLNGNIDPRTDHTPAAAFFRGKLYVVYKGSGNNDVFLTIYDGVEWSGDQKISEISGGVAKPTSGESPALIVFNDKLYLMCGGSDSDTSLKYFTFDGTNWSSGVRVKVGNNNTGTNHGVSLAVYNNKIYTVYKGTGDEDLRWLSFDGQEWAGDQRIKDTGNKAIKPKTDGSNPGLASYNGSLYIFYKGAGNEDIFTASFDGTNWSGDQRLNWKVEGRSISPRSSEAPRCFVWQENSTESSLNIIYKGESTGHLYMATLAQGQWSGNDRIVIASGLDSEPEPQSAHAPGFGAVPIASTEGSADWMTINRAVIGEKSLAQVTLPSSHDTGMHNCAAAIPLVSGYEYTSRTQEMDLYSQVVYGGARILDLRPIYYAGNMATNGYYSAHYTDTWFAFFGFLGQSLDSLCQDIRQALKTLADGEILIINVSHGCAFGETPPTDVTPLSAERQIEVIGRLLNACSGHLYTSNSEDPVNFLELTVNNILSQNNNSTVLFRLTDDTYKHCGKTPRDGCFSKDAYLTTSTNPNTDSETTFFKETQKNIRKHTKSDTAASMSWQLTWKFPDSTGLQDFAKKLNPQLGPKLTDWQQAGLFTTVNRPVAIGWDFIKPVNQAGGSKDPTFAAVLSFNGLV